MIHCATKPSKCFQKNILVSNFINNFQFKEWSYLTNIQFLVVFELYSLIYHSVHCSRQDAHSKLLMHSNFWAIFCPIKRELRDWGQLDIAWVRFQIPSKFQYKFTYRTLLLHFCNAIFQNNEFARSVGIDWCDAQA